MIVARLLSARKRGRGFRGPSTASAHRSERLDDFRTRLREHGFRIVHQEDITAHVLPTLGFARLLADRIGLPALDFANDKLRAKSPGLHYVVENVVERARNAAVRSAAVLDPANFATERQYLIMSIRRVQQSRGRSAPDGSPLECRRSFTGLLAPGRSSKEKRTMSWSTAAVRPHRCAPRTGALACILAAAPLAAQDVTIVDYEPRNTLVVPENPLTRAKFPFVDIHGHQRATRMSAADVDRLVAEMDELNMAVMVNLSGGSGISLVDGLENMTARHPGRFVFFANINFFGVGEPGWGEEAAAQLEEDVRNGAAGLKIFKGLGMSDRDTDGDRIPVDDPRLAPVWDKAGELGIPVLIHTADPASLAAHAIQRRWSNAGCAGADRPPDRFPSFEQIIGEQHNLFRNHPNTNFIAAHLGWLGHDLGRLGKLLDEIPNMYVGLGAVVYELGRQPRFARQWLIEYQDRVLMGKDSYNKEEFHTYFRVFETADDYFTTTAATTPSGRCTAWTCPTRCCGRSTMRMP